MRLKKGPELSFILIISGRKPMSQVIITINNVVEWLSRGEDC